MPRYIIEETAIYEVEADSREEAEQIFLEDISCGPRILNTDVPE